MLLLAVVAVVYFVLLREAPVKPVAAVVTAEEAAPLISGPRAPGLNPATTALKRPFDRTHAVLEQARQRNGAGGEF